MLGDAGLQIIKGLLIIIIIFHLVDLLILHVTRTAWQQFDRKTGRVKRGRQYRRYDAFKKVTRKSSLSSSTLLRYRHSSAFLVVADASSWPVSRTKGSNALTRSTGRSTPAPTLLWRCFLLKQVGLKICTKMIFSTIKIYINKN
jgi:hypothetical protein